MRQKEFICKPCHKQLKDGKYSNNVQNCDNSDLFGSHLNHAEGSQDNVHESKIHNENNMTCDFPSLYMTQTTTLTNYCLCTCFHKTDIPRSQCTIFKEAKYQLWKCCCVRSIIKQILNSYIQGIHLQEM